MSKTLQVFLDALILEFSSYPQVQLRLLNLRKTLRAKIKAIDAYSLEMRNNMKITKEIQKVYNELEDQEEVVTVNKAAEKLNVKVSVLSKFLIERKDFEHLKIDLLPEKMFDKVSIETVKEKYLSLVKTLNRNPTKVELMGFANISKQEVMVFKKGFKGIDFKYDL